jgi:hypothetical protein
MPKIKPLKRALLLAGLLLLVGAVGAQPAPPSVRLRGAIEKADAASLVVKERDGRVIPLVYADNLAVSEVVPIDPSVLQSGTFVGATAVPGPDGSLLALEVHVFAEAARGTGEGHRPSDLQPGATMTNAAVASVAAGADDRILVLRYKDGEKTIRVPNGVPVVTMRPGDRSLLVAGAKVIVTGQMRDGRNVATRIIVGRNGFAPPM